MFGHETRMRLSAALPYALPALALVLLTWPLAVDPVGQLIGAPDLEAIDHLWTLWLGLRDGPLLIETQRVDFPKGFTWVLGDPLHLLPYGLGELLGGPALGFNLVQLWSLALGGLAAAVAAPVFLREEAPPAWLSATFGICGPAMLGGLFTGMTEAQPMGWVLLSLAGLVAAARQPTWGRVAAAAAALGACFWSGPYVAIYAGMLLAPLGCALLLGAGRAGALRVAGVGLAVGLLGLLIGAPVIDAILHHRPAGVPGTGSIADAVIAEPGLPQNRMLGADLGQLLLPLRSAIGADLHVVYLGSGMLVLGLIGARLRQHALLVGLFALSVVLSLGFWLQVGGQMPEVGGQPVFLPAGVLSVQVDALGQSPRWYRMAMVAGLLLAPLAGAGVERLVGAWPRGGGWLRLGAALLVIADATFLTPLPWPRATIPLRLPEGMSSLPEGPWLELPRPRGRLVSHAAGTPVAAGGAQSTGSGLRHPELLYQTVHGHSMAANVYQPPTAETRSEADRIADRLLEIARDGDPEEVASLRARLVEMGFVWIVHVPTGKTSERRFSPTLGPADVRHPGLLAWRLTAP
jgi:hypothetical protein